MEVNKDTLLKNFNNLDYPVVLLFVEDNEFVFRDLNGYHVSTDKVLKVLGGGGEKA